MLTDSVTQRLKTWLIGLFVKAINGIARPEERAEAVRWLSQSRDVLASDTSAREKFTELNALINARRTASFIASSVVETVRNYKNSDLPLPVKIAVPVTLLAVPFVGGQGAGIAALGSAMGVPALLLVFLGAAGVTSVLEAITQGGLEDEGYLSVVMEMIARDEILRQASAVLRKAMQEEPRQACRQTMPSDEAALQAQLLTMDPFDFERHVMSFFAAAGMDAWATKKSNDMGVDGFARHPRGLMVVQCKRHASGNPVGRPVVQQLKGVVAENDAFRGYLVTTSTFTEEAKVSARMSDRLVLVDMAELVRWHFGGVPVEEEMAL